MPHIQVRFFRCITPWSVMTSYGAEIAKTIFLGKKVPLLNAA
jgi:hypothetical protein